MRSRQSIPRGFPVAAASALFLGLSPVFGKQALLAGMGPLAVVAVRTAGATGLLMLGMLLFNRRYLYIYPVGLVGCLLAGGLNGIGSLLYYGALARIDASLGQLLYSMYPLFVALLLYLDGQRYSRATLVRLGVSLVAVYLLSATSSGRVDVLGIAMMLGASLLYALHIPINQRVLYEAPAPTVTLYTLMAMTVVVVPVYALFAPEYRPAPEAALLPILALTAVTFLSRLTLFAGVKLIGGLETTLIGLGELLVTLLLAFFWLGETLTLVQWIGAGLLSASLLTGSRGPSQPPPSGLRRGWLHWLVPPMPAWDQAGSPQTPTSEGISAGDRPSQ